MHRAVSWSGWPKSQTSLTTTRNLVLIARTSRESDKSYAAVISRLVTKNYCVRNALSTFFLPLSLSSPLRRRHGPAPGDGSQKDQVSRSRHTWLPPRFSSSSSTRERQTNDDENAGNNYIVGLEREESKPLLGTRTLGAKMNRSLGCQSSRARFDSSRFDSSRSSSVAFTFVRLSRERILSRSRADFRVDPGFPERILSSASPRLVLRKDRFARPAGRPRLTFVYLFYFAHPPLLPPTIDNICVPQGYSNGSLRHGV